MFQSVLPLLITVGVFLSPVALIFLAPVLLTPESQSKFLALLLMGVVIAFLVPFAENREITIIAGTFAAMILKVILRTIAAAKERGSRHHRGFID